MNLLRGLIVVGAILALPFTGYAQEAAISGTVTDTTGGVLPGVTVTARHVATGNTFVAVTDERGVYRLDVRIGTYEVTAELQGFATMVRGGLALLVGQQAVANLQLAPAGLQESVTVTGEAPLVDVTSSTVGGNIDPRQMQDLPLSGRSWQDLTMLAPGNRRNESGDSPTVRTRRDFHINLDGQQTTSILVQGGGTGTGASDQPLYSKDAIAEFQFVSSRFNATQGRSIGTQVNAVTKSGTNTPSGSFGVYFRDDRFIGKDFVTGTVVPYQNQQISGTFGGPILRDRLHIFGNYEYEREPGSIVYTTPYPSFNLTLPNTRTQKMAGTRVDWQMSTQTRLMARANYGIEFIPNEGGGPNHPSGATEFKRHNDEIFTTLTQVLGDRSLNELKAGFASFFYYNYSVVNWPDHPMAASQGITIGTPRVLFTGFSVGPAANNPQRLGQTVWSLRDDFTHSVNARGRHDLKVGGEYLFMDAYTSNCRGCQGQYTVTGAPVPANIEQIFPVWNDVSTWRLDMLSPIITRYDVTVGKMQTYQTRNTFGGWFQDDWAIASRLTLNLGIRYDLALGQLANDIVIEPFLPPGRPEDTNNFGPRAGFNYSLNDRTVLRGGYGLFFGEIANTMTSRTQSWTQLTGATVENLAPRRANFGSSPFNGPIPTYAQAQERYCHRNNVPGCLREGLEQLVDPYGKVMYSHQSSAGFQRQIGSTMAVEADYTYEGERGGFYSHRSNLTYDPVTGVNYPFSDISRRAYPLYAAIGIERLARRSNIHVLQSAWTKRFSNRWSATGTYTLARYSDAQAPPLSGIDQVTFPVAPDLGGEYTLSEGDQRHRAVLSGIWDAGYGFQLSGLYFFGSGMRRSTDWGGDLRQTGVAAQGGRLRPNGTVVPRNNFVGDPLHRVDMRLQRRFRFGSAAGIDGMLEVFNLFNHENFGSYTTNESNARYGLPNVNTNVAYQPRSLQFGLRATF